MAQALEGLGGTAGGGFSVHTYTITGQTIAGERALRTVVAQRPGSTSATPIMILAHRDAAGVGGSSSEAELSGTAALLELARVFATRATKRTIVLVSTSGGSGGDAAAAAHMPAGHLSCPTPTGSAPLRCSSSARSAKQSPSRCR